MLTKLCECGCGNNFTVKRLQQINWSRYHPDCRDKMQKIKRDQWYEEQACLKAIADKKFGELHRKVFDECESVIL